MEPMRPDVAWSCGHYRCHGNHWIYPIYFASFVAMIVGPLIHIALTRATGGRYYKPKRTATQTEVNALDEADDDHDPLSV